MSNELNYLKYSLNKLEKNKDLATEFFITSVAIEAVTALAKGEMTLTEDELEELTIFNAIELLKERNLISYNEKGYLHNIRIMRNYYTHDLIGTAAMILNSEYVFEMEMSSLEIITNILKRFGINLNEEYILNKYDILKLNESLFNQLKYINKITEKDFGKILKEQLIKPVETEEESIDSILDLLEEHPVVEPQPQPTKQSNPIVNTQEPKSGIIFLDPNKLKE